MNETHYGTQRENTTTTNTQTHEARTHSCGQIPGSRLINGDQEIEDHVYRCEQHSATHDNHVSKNENQMVINTIQQKGKDRNNKKDGNQIAESYGH